MTRASRSIFVWFACFALLACASVKQTVSSLAKTSLGKALHIADEPASQPPKEAPVKFREALALLEDMKYEQAYLALEAFLAAEPTSPWTQSAFYHEGRALEGMGQWSDAVERYRGVAAACAEQAPKLQAMALYRLSFCHEALGDDQQTLADLHDLLGREGGLAPEVRGAELPARLAGAYARVGNFDQAVEFYKQAEAGILKLKHAAHGADLPAWFPQTLYFMGSLSKRNIGWDDYASVLRPLARSQVYLLQTAELGIAPWAERAEKDLLEIYGSLWNSIQNPPTEAGGDPLLKLRDVQIQQWDRAELLMENLEELKARAMLTEPKHGSEASRAILAFERDLEKKIVALLAVRRAGEGPTEASIRRRMESRGRTLSPDETLERKFLNSSRPSKTKPDEDPNL